MTKESYLFAVFQLCDQWTETVDVDEFPPRPASVSRGAPDARPATPF